MISKKTHRPEWQLQTAKAQFSRVVNEALENGPQLVTKAGRPAVYIVSAETYESELSLNTQDRKSILLTTPHRDCELNVDRSKDEGREIEL